MSTSPVSHRRPLPSGYGGQEERYGLGLQDASLRSPPQQRTPQAQRITSPEIIVPTSPQSHRRIASDTSSISFPISDAQATQAAQQFTTGKSLLEGYREDITNNFQGEKPRCNPLNTARTNSSHLLNMGDPIHMHLLVETALDDAQSFEILSHEEVDELKKLCRSLEQRVGQTRQNLAIQSKYRDAAVNMAKLYTSKDGEKKHRLSMGFNRNSHSEQLRDADLERQNSEKRCEELAQELWSLEKRLIQPQMKLLQHTAGVLQLTHKGPRKGAAQQPGMPGSPESMSYSNFRNSMEPQHGEDLFDERHHYRTFEGLEKFDLDGNRRSHMAKKDTDMDNEEYLKLKEESMKSAERIASTEAKLDELSNRLRMVIIRATPQRDSSYTRPPHIYAEDVDTGDLLVSQLQYLEQGIRVIDEQQEEADATMEQTIGKLNRDVRSLLLPFNSSIEEPPQITGRTLEEQLRYFQSTVNHVEFELQRAASTASELTAELNRAKSTRTLDVVSTESPANIQTVLEGLWDVIQAGEEDEMRRKKQHRQTQIDNGQEVDNADDDLDFLPEIFSVPAFSAKVQRLWGEASRLKDQKEVLQRQIKQQRELNNKTDEVRDAEQAALEAELKQCRDLLERAQYQADDLQRELSSVIEQLSKTKSVPATWEEDKEKLLEEAAELRDVLFDRNEEIDGLKEQLTEVSRRGEKESEDTKFKLTQIQQQMANSSERVFELETTLKKADAQIKHLTEELDAAHNTTRGSSKVLAETESRIDELSAELKEVRASEAGMSATITKLKEKEEMLEELLKSLSEHEQAVDNLHRALEEKELALEKMTKSHGDNSEMMEKLSSSLKKKEQDLEDQTMELANLRTEVTIARAELEGAYGTRAERAADIAANPLVQKEIDDLLQSNINLQEEIQIVKQGGGAKTEELKKELREAMEEFQKLTKMGVEWERERANMEGEIDKLRDEREQLESRLSEERVRWLGVSSPGPGTPGSSRGGDGAMGRGERNTTSASVLKNEFKKMMRDTRAESARVLRVCFVVPLLIRW